MSFQDLQDDHSRNQLAFEQPLDFLDEMLPTLPPYPWSDLNSSNQNLLNPRHSTDQYRFDDSALLASEFQADGSDPGNSSAAKSAGVKLLHQMLLARGDSGSGNLVQTARTSPSATAGLGICSLPLSLVNDTMDRQQNDVVELASFKCISSVTGEDGSMQASCKRFAGPVNATGRTWSQPRFHSPQNFGAAGGVMNQAPASGSIGAAQVQSKQKVRARRGKATDPHSIAERLRRERISERMKALQELFPNANKTDKGSMLDEIIEYVKFLQLQVKVLSMSRLGGAEAVPDMSYQANGWLGRNPDGNRTVTTDDVMTVTELRVAKLMEEDVGSAMQYLQEKGLCLMPVSLATLISAATCYSRRTLLPSPTVDGTPSPRHAHPHRSVS